MTPDPVDGEEGPPRPPVAEGPSFPATTRFIATIIVAALAASAWPVLRRGLLSSDTTLQLAVGLGMVFVMVGYFTILTSRTGIDEKRIYQTGLMGKQMPIRNITQVRLVHIPGLRWLIVPRLVAKAGALRTLSFPTADPEVLRAFQVLAYGRDAADRSERG